MNIHRASKDELQVECARMGADLDMVAGMTRDDMIEWIQDQNKSTVKKDIAAKQSVEMDPTTEPRVKLKIHGQEEAAGDAPVAVGVNGTVFLIKRNEEVMVPRSVVEVLDNAVETRLEQQKDLSYKERSFPRVQYSTRG